MGSVVTVLLCLCRATTAAAQHVLHLPFGDSVTILSAGRVGAGFHVRFQTFGGADSARVKDEVLKLFRVFRSQVDGTGARLVVLEAIPDAGGAPFSASDAERYTLIIEKRADSQWYVRGESSPIETF